MIALLVIVCVLVYLVIGAAVSLAVERMWELDPEVSPFPFFSGVFWPVALIIVIAISINRAMRHALERRSDKQVDIEHELRARVRELERQLQQARERPPSLGPHR